MSGDADPIWLRLQEEGLLGHRPARYLAQAVSTNDLALAAAAAGEDWALVVADEQSRGRGRLRRQWHSPPGVGLYLSLLYRPRLAPEDLAKLTLAAGLAVALAMERVTGLTPGLKWPNDLLLAGKKCGGILCECALVGGGPAAAGGVGQRAGLDHALTPADGAISPDVPEENNTSACGKPPFSPAAAGRPAVVVGIGLNVNTAVAMIPPELRQRVTSLRLVSGRSWLRGELLAAIAEAMDAQVARLEAGEFAAILEQWRQRDALLGRELEWLSVAGQVVRGIALGPDADGLLRIRDGQGQVHPVISGDLKLRGRLEA